MNVPEGVSLPLKIEFFQRPTQGDSICMISDQNDQIFARCEPRDSFGFGEEEIERLTFLVESANLQAERNP